MMAEQKTAVPFSKSFVMSTTFKHFYKSIDISTSKSLKRMEEFEGDKEKGLEIFETVQVLFTVRKMLEEFESKNSSLFNNN